MSYSYVADYRIEALQDLEGRVRSTRAFPAGPMHLTLPRADDALCGTPVGRMVDWPEALWDSAFVHRCEGCQEARRVAACISTGKPV